MARHASGRKRWLARAGYRGVTLQRVFDAWHGGPSCLQAGGDLVRRRLLRPVSNACPTLLRHGWPGVLNLKLDNLADMGGVRNSSACSPRWEIDAHTLTHPDLTTVSAGQLR